MEVQVQHLMGIQLGMKDLHLDKEDQPHEKPQRRKKTYPPLKVLNPFQNPLCQGHGQPVGSNLSNVDVIWLSPIKQPLCHQMFQDPVPIWKAVDPLRHLTSSLDARLEKEVDQMEVVASMIIPFLPTLHTKSNGCRQRIRTGILASRIPSPVIRGKRLPSDDTMQEGTTSEVLVVLKRHNG